MGKKTLLRVEQIAELARAMEDVPSYNADEVTVTKAVRTLAPQIASMRAKGYTFASIAAWLSEKGVVVSATALRVGLRRGETSSDRPKKRPKRNGSQGLADPAQTAKKASTKKTTNPGADTKETSNARA